MPELPEDELGSVFIGVEQSVIDEGGRIVRETFEFPGGRRFHYFDPDGNELALWSDS